MCLWGALFLAQLSKHADAEPKRFFGAGRLRRGGFAKAQIASPGKNGGQAHGAGSDRRAIDPITSQDSETAAGARGDCRLMRPP